MSKVMHPKLKRLILFIQCSPCTAILCRFTFYRRRISAPLTPIHPTPRSFCSCRRPCNTLCWYATSYFIISVVLTVISLHALGVSRYFTVQSALTKGYFPVARLTTGFIAVMLTALVALTFAVLMAGKLVPKGIWGHVPDINIPPPGLEYLKFEASTSKNLHEYASMISH